MEFEDHARRMKNVVSVTLVNGFLIEESLISKCTDTLACSCVICLIFLNVLYIVYAVQINLKCVHLDLI